MAQNNTHEENSERLRYFENISYLPPDTQEAYIEAWNNKVTENTTVKKRKDT